MRLDRGRPEIRSRSYSNRLLIDFFDPNSVRESIEIVATIRNIGPNLNLTSNLYQKKSNLIGNSSILIENQSFWKSTALESESSSIQFGDPNRISLVYAMVQSLTCLVKSYLPQLECLTFFPPKVR